MAPPILSLRDLSLAYGATPLFQQLELHVGGSDRITLIGRNGTGKSTLMKVMAGRVQADSGERFMQPGLNIAYLEQEPDTAGYATLGAYMASGLPAAHRDEFYRVEALAPDLNVNLDADPAASSGGEVRRAAIIRAILSEPDLLLLDEPTNHLDINAIMWLENYLKGWRGALILISHDRSFLRALATSVLWLDRGQIRRYDGPFDGFDTWQEEQFALEAERLKKLDKKIAEETRWSVEGISARRTRNQGRMRALYALREERRNVIRPTGSVDMAVKAGDASGKVVIEANDVSKAYDDKALFSGVNLRVLRGDRLGLIGPNGAGKSTMLKILLGDISSDTGSVKLGTNLTPLIIDQNRADLNEDLTVAEVLTGGRGDWVISDDGSRKHVKSYMSDFLFDKSMANTPVSSLSGGERGRLLLARGFVNPTNLMVLDEPTNDLDMDTLDLLVDLLAEYQGTLILVSHDRDFLDRIVTQSLVLEGDGSATVYAGGHSDYLAQKKLSGAAAPVKADKASSSKPSATVTPITAAKPKKQNKLSYKDQRELDMLPEQVEILSHQIDEAEARLADPDFYTKDPAGFNALGKELAKLRDEVEEKEMRWLELEELKDSLGQS